MFDIRDLEKRLTDLEQVCGGLKEVSIAPSITHSTKFKRIPVEKSGGGV